MKRLFSCCLLALCLCCGCGSTEKPEPIHLDESGAGALGLLLPGQNGMVSETQKPNSDSQVLGDLLGQDDIVPQVAGFDTQTLQEQYAALEEETAAALEDTSIDRAALRTRIQQMQGVVSLQTAQVKTANLAATDAEQLERFYQGLADHLTGLLNDLKE